MEEDPFVQHLGTGRGSGRGDEPAESEAPLRYQPVVHAIADVATRLDEPTALLTEAHRVARPEVGRLGLALTLVANGEYRRANDPDIAVQTGIYLVTELMKSEPVGLLLVELDERDTQQVPSLTFFAPER